MKNVFRIDSSSCNFLRLCFVHHGGLHANVTSDFRNIYSFNFFRYANVQALVSVDASESHSRRLLGFIAVYLRFHRPVQPRNLRFW